MHEIFLQVFIIISDTYIYSTTKNSKEKKKQGIRQTTASVFDTYTYDNFHS